MISNNRQDADSSTYLEPPEIRPMAEEVQVVLHHGTVLPCEARGFPRPTITWQREGIPIAAGNATQC